MTRAARGAARTDCSEFLLSKPQGNARLFSFFARETAGLFLSVNRSAIDPGGTVCHPYDSFSFYAMKNKMAKYKQRGFRGTTLFFENSENRKPKTQLKKFISVDNYDKIVYNTIESREVRFIDTFICLYGTVSFLLECNGLI